MTTHAAPKSADICQVVDFSHSCISIIIITWYNQNMPARPIPTSDCNWKSWSPSYWISIWSNFNIGITPPAAMHQLVWNGWHEAVKGPNLANAPFSCGRCGHQSNGDGGEGTMMQAAGQWCPGVLWKLTGIWKSHLSLKRNHSGMRNPNSHSKGNGWDPILRKQLTVNVWGSIEGVCTDYKQMWKIKHCNIQKMGHPTPHTNGTINDGSIV